MKIWIGVCQFSLKDQQIKVIFLSKCQSKCCTPKYRFHGTTIKAHQRAPMTNLKIPTYYLVSLRDWNLFRCSKCFSSWIQTKISEYFALRFFQFVTLLLESRDVLTLCWLLVYHTVPHGSATFHFTPNTLYHTDCQKFFQEMKLSCILFLTLSYALHSDASKEMEHFQIRVAAMLPRSQTNLPHSVKLYSTQFHNP